MPSTSAVALSGMNAAQASLQASAHNIANAGTVGFRRQRIEVRRARIGITCVASRLGAPLRGDDPQDVVETTCDDVGEKANSRANKSVSSCP